MVLTTPLMESVKALHPSATFSWVTTPEAAGILKYDPWIERLFPFDKNRAERSLSATWRLGSTLRAERFDLALGVQRSLRTSMLVKFANASESVGFSEAAFSSLYRVRRNRARDASHEVVRNLSLLEEQSKLPLRLVAKPASESAAVWTGLGIDPARCVVLGVGSAWATKRWTVGGFIAVAKAVQARGLTPVLLGGRADAARAEIVAEHVPGIFNLQLEIPDSIALISRSAAVVCHDSFILHVASAFSRPTVVVFCSTVPTFGFGPWLNPRARVVEDAQLPCKPCGRHGHQRCPTGTWACSLQVSAGEVINALDAVLSD